MEENDNREIYITPIKKFFELISARAFNVCQYNEIITVGDLLRYHYDGKLLLLRNCGKKTVKELENLIDVIGCSKKHDPDINSDPSVVSDPFSIQIKKYYDEGMISGRALSCCMKNNISTVSELIRYQQDGNFKGLFNCGPKTINEFEKIIESVELFCDNKLARYFSVSEAIREIIEKRYNTPLLGFSESCIELFHIIFDTPCSFYSFFCLDQNDLANRFNSIESLELKLYCYQVLSDIHSLIRKEHLTGKNTYESIVVAKAILWFCDDRFAEKLEVTDYDLKVRKKVILADYAERNDELSSRASRVRRSQIPEYLDVITLFQLTEKQLKNCLFPKQIMRTTFVELFQYVNRLKDALFHFESLVGDELINSYITNKFPYLSEEHKSFVSNYYLQNSSFPMFFLLRQYLMKSENRVDRLFSMSTGFIDGHSMNMAEIARNLGYSRERVRQILNTCSKSLFTDKEWKRYHLYDSLVITQDDEVYLDVVNKEKVDITFDLFAHICSLGFPLKKVKVNETSFLVSNRFDKSIIDKACRDADRIMAKKKPFDVYYRVDILLQNVPATQKNDYKRMLSIIMGKAYGLVIDEESKIVFHKNVVHVVYELWDILRLKGKPMSLTELFAELKQRQPDLKYDNPQQIRSIILRSYIIKPIGKTSKYGLSEWEDVFWGGIKDFVAQLLLDAEEPLHIDSIMEQVLLLYPQTNRKSVVSSLNSDKKRFVLFGEGVYGLEGKVYNTNNPNHEKKSLQLSLFQDD